MKNIRFCLIVMRFNNIRLVLTGLLTLILVSCGPKVPKVDHIKVEFNIIPFYQDLFSIKPDSVEFEKERLMSEYGKYLDAYSMRIIGSGPPHSDEFSSNIGRFLSYEPNKEVLDTCKKVFSNLNGLKKELEGAFKFYSYYFPGFKVPDVYLHISGFNQSVVVDSSWVSVSVEKYLGSECVFYEWLSIPVYLRNRMVPERVAPDIIKAITMTQFLYNDSVNDLLSQMIYQGTILYALRHLIPYHSDEIIFGYSKKNMDWCYHYESMMWSYMVEKKHLFSNDRMMIQKYIGESPFTNYFGQDSPGRTGAFIGYRIVQSFMKKNPEVSLNQLMGIGDYRLILSKSGYRP